MLDASNALSVEATSRAARQTSATGALNADALTTERLF